MYSAFDSTTGPADALIKNLSENTAWAALALNDEESMAELIRANREFFCLFEYSAEEAEKSARTFSELIIHPDDHNEFIHSIMRTGADRHNICRAVTGSGRTIWIGFSSFSIFENGQPCYVCTFQNVTEAQETKNELEAVKKALALSAAKSSDVCCMIDFSERTLNFPKIFSHRYSIPECISGMPEGLFRSGFINEAYREAISTLYFDIKNGLHEGNCIFKFTPPNQSSLWLKAIVTAVDGRDCSVSKAIVMISNISDQMTSDESLSTLIGPQYENETFSCTINLCKSRIISCRNARGVMRSVSGNTMYDSTIITSLISRTHPEDRNLIAENITVKNLWKNYFAGNLSKDFHFRIKGFDDKYIPTTAHIRYYSENGSGDVLLNVTFCKEHEDTSCCLHGDTEPSSVKPRMLVSRDIFKALVNEHLSSPDENQKFQALYVLDINGFMDISRKHGYETGRKILDAVSDAILKIKQPSFAGKMYGDEFLIFIKDIDSYDDININAKQICSLCRNIELPPEVEPDSVTGCTGVAYAPLHGNDFDTLYRKAEISLHSAKRFDRTRYAIFSDETATDRRQLSPADFMEKAAEIIRKDEGIYHLYNADIKHFRNINHSMGYEKGDTLLQKICSMLQDYLKSGEYFTRLFGDNFLLITKVGDSETVAARMEEIKTRLLEIHISDSGEVQFAAGYVTIDNSNRSAEFEQLLDCSIIAHEKAKKEKGTAFVRFEPGMGDEDFRKFEILSEISKAVKNGQICTFVQPQYDILNREYVSMEALVRWNHPVRGLLSPDSFIGVCEENGFISSIDFCVLEQMCSFIRTRLDSNLRVLPVAINQSQVTIHEKGYVKRLIALVEKYNVPPEYIVLEVTESACVNNFKETNRILSELRDYGFHISMDDFGTGYSTLNLLKDIPVDSLKIDKAFLTKNLVEKKPTEIIKSITSMAHNINIRVVCEGVEFPQQVKFLENIGCELVQGFLFGKPMPYSDINEFMDENIISWSCGD